MRLYLTISLGHGHLRWHVLTRLGISKQGLFEHSRGHLHKHLLRAGRGDWSRADKARFKRGTHRRPPDSFPATQTRLSRSDAEGRGSLTTATGRPHRLVFPAVSDSEGRPELERRIASRFRL